MNPTYLRGEYLLQMMAAAATRPSADFRADRQAILGLWRDADAADRQHDRPDRGGRHHPRRVTKAATPSIDIEASQ